MSKFYTHATNNFFANLAGDKSGYYFVEQRDDGEFWFIYPYNSQRDNESEYDWNSSLNPWRPAEMPADTTNPYLISLMQPEYKIKVNSQEEFETLNAFFSSKGWQECTNADWGYFCYRGFDKKYQRVNGWNKESRVLHDTPVYASLKDFFLNKPMENPRMKLSNTTAIRQENGFTIGNSFLSFGDIKLLNASIK